MKNQFKICSLFLALAAVDNLAAQLLPGTVLWTYEATGSLGSAPSLAPDGTVYLMSNGLNAITNSGSTASNKWKFSVDGGMPAIGSDGTIYFVGYYGIYAVTPSSAQKWFYPVSGANSLPAIGLDDTIYFVAEGRLYAVSATGIKKWDYVMEESASHWSYVQSPVIGADGTIYVGIESTLYAFIQDGTNKWSTSFSFFGKDSPAIGASGTIYSFTDKLYAFGPNGTNLWSADVGSGYGGSSIIGKDGSIYVGDTTRALYAVTPSGQVSWHALSNAPRYGSLTAAAVDAGGTIYYCVSDAVWALNPQGQVQWSISNPNVPDPRVDVASTSPIIGPDGTLYAALGTTLYAIATGTNGPANSPWPMYRQNVRHTGKVEKPALKQPRKRADANFEFQLYAQLGQTNTVESTTDLSTWTSLASVLVTNVPMDFVDLTASNFPSRFYRTTSPP